MMTKFHRRANKKTQTLSIAVQQNRNCQLWGRGAFGSSLPAALAYIGALPDQEQGTEFTTEVPYARNGDPAWAYWYTPEHGGDDRVQKKEIGQDTFACVAIDPTCNRYKTANCP